MSSYITSRLHSYLFYNKERSKKEKEKTRKKGKSTKKFKVFLPLWSVVSYFLQQLLVDYIWYKRETLLMSTTPNTHTWWVCMKNKSWLCVVSSLLVLYRVWATPWDSSSEAIIFTYKRFCFLHVLPCLKISHCLTRIFHPWQRTSLYAVLAAKESYK